MSYPCSFCNTPSEIGDTELINTNNIFCNNCRCFQMFDNFKNLIYYDFTIAEYTIYFHITINRIIIHSDISRKSFKLDVLPNIKPTEPKQIIINKIKTLINFS